MLNLLIFCSSCGMTWSNNTTYKVNANKYNSLHKLNGEWIANMKVIMLLLFMCDVLHYVPNFYFAFGCFLWDFIICHIKTHHIY